MKILKQENRPKHIILTGPNHLHRAAQLFYDDVVCNASPFGLRKMMINNNYKEARIRYRNRQK